MSLEELRETVDLDASLHKEDVILSAKLSAQFQEIDMRALFDSEAQNTVGLTLSEGIGERQHAFTDWSRSQLLSMLGVREKWFHAVSKQREAEEMNMRIPMLYGQRVRLAHDVAGDYPVHMVRGIVGASYASITNKEILDTMCKDSSILEGSGVLRHHSGLTDRAFYAYFMLDAPVEIPGTTMKANVGVVIKNSEVGYSSLWALPALIVGEERKTPLVYSSRPLMRQVHRGRGVDLKAIFEEKVPPKLKSFRALLQVKVSRLREILYPTADDALEAMRTALLSCGAQQEFIRRCSSAFAPKGIITAVNIFEAVNAACLKQDSRDKKFDEGALAGALLFKLVAT